MAAKEAGTLIRREELKRQALIASIARLSIYGF